MAKMTLNIQPENYWESVKDPVFSISTANLPTAMKSSTAVYDGEDSIYILGGFDGISSLRHILKFKISAERIEKVGEFPEGRGFGTAILDGTGIVYFGGYFVESKENPVVTSKASIRRYMPGKSLTQAAESLPTANCKSAIISTSRFGEALIFGGTNNGKRIVKYEKNLAVEITDSRLPIEVFGASVIHCKNNDEDFAYLFGGYNSEVLDSIIKYNIVNGESSVLCQTLPYPLSLSSAVYNEAYAYIIGGESKENTSVIRFNPLTKEMVKLNINNFPNQLTRAPAVYVEKLKRAYIFGGSSAGIETRSQIMYLTF